MGARGRVSVAALVVAGLAAAWALTSGPLQGAVEGSDGDGDGSAGSYDSELWRYDTGTGQRFFSLPDGKAAMAYGSPDRHRVVVQFRDPDGEGWTAPETVYRDDETEALDEAVRYGGGTLAIVQDFVPPDAGEDDSALDSVVLACRGTTCAEPLRVDGHVDEPQVSADGRTALFGAREGEVVRWTPERGVHVQPVAGVPEPFFFGGASSQPQLTPDGGLRIVSWSAGEGRCDLRLLTASRDDTEVSEVARTGVPGRARSCARRLDTLSTDWVEVASASGPAEAFWWFREGAGWARTAEDPSGLIRLDDRAYAGRRCCEPTVFGAVRGWNELAVGSPDGRGFSVQTHLLGEESWRPRQLVAGAPPGVRCTSLDSASDEYGDRFVGLLTCHTGEIGDPYRGDAVAVAATEDLRTWDSFYVAGLDVRPSVTEDAVVASGDRLVVWEAGGEPQTIDLPMPDGSATTRSPDGTLVQARASRRGTGCALDVVVAEPGSGAWGDPVASTVGPLADMPDCRIDGAYAREGDGAELLLEDGGRGTFLRVLPTEDGWVVRRSGDG